MNELPTTEVDTLMASSEFLSELDRHSKLTLHDPEEKLVQALQAQERARYKNVSPAGWGGGVMSNNESPGWFT